MRVGCSLLSGGAASCHVLAAVDTTGSEPGTPRELATLLSSSRFFCSSHPPLWPLRLFSRWGTSLLGMGRESVRRVCWCMIGPPCPLGFHHWPNYLELHVSCKKMSAEQGTFDEQVCPEGFAILVCGRGYKSGPFRRRCFSAKAKHFDAINPWQLANYTTSCSLP
ncbi:hypothetical protein V8C26DRAFT_299215 [Trichoderma gracile]